MLSSSKKRKSKAKLCGTSEKPVVSRRIDDPDNLSSSTPNSLPTPGPPPPSSTSNSLAPPDHIPASSIPYNSPPLGPTPAFTTPYSSSPSGPTPPSSTSYSTPNSLSPSGRTPPSSTPYSTPNSLPPSGPTPPSSTPGPTCTSPSSTPYSTNSLLPSGRTPTSSTPYSTNTLPPSGPTPPSSTPYSIPNSLPPSGPTPPSSTPGSTSPSSTSGQTPPFSTPYNLPPPHPTPSNSVEVTDVSAPKKNRLTYTLSTPTPLGSKQCRPQSKDKRETIAGFVHSVTPVNMSKTGTRFSNFILQTASKYTRCVTFNPSAHRDVLLAGSHSRAPIEFRNIRYGDSLNKFGEKDIILDHVSTVATVEDNLPFRCKQEETKCMSLRDLCKQKDWSTVNIQGKVIADGELQNLNNVTQQDKSIADETGSCRLSAWSTLPSLLLEGHSYKLCNLVVKTWQDEKYLSSTVTTVHQEIEPLTIPFDVDLSSVLTTSQISVSVDSASLTKSLKCKNLKCSTLLKMPENHSPLLVCSSCNTMHKMSKMEVIYKGTASLTNLANNEEINATFTSTALSEFVASITKNTSTVLSETDLQSYLVSEPEVLVKLDNKTCVIEAIQIPNSSAHDGILSKAFNDCLLRNF